MKDLSERIAGRKARRADKQSARHVAVYGGNLAAERRKRTAWAVRRLR
jgi:hypothetical protein